MRKKLKTAWKVAHGNPSSIQNGLLQLQSMQPFNSEVTIIKKGTKEHKQIKRKVGA